MLIYLNSFVHHTGSLQSSWCIYTVLNMESTESGECLYDKLNPSQSQESMIRQVMPRILTPAPVHPSGSRSASASAAVGPVRGWATLQFLPPRNVSRIPLPSRSSSVRLAGDRPAAIAAHFLTEGVREETLDERSVETTGSVDSVKYAKVEERNKPDGGTWSEMRGYADLQLHGLAPSSQYTSPSVKRKNAEEGTESPLTPASNSSGNHDTLDGEAAKKRTRWVARIMGRSGLRAVDYISGSLALVALSVALLAMALAIYSHVSLGSDKCTQYTQCSGETRLLVGHLQEQLDALQKQFSELVKLSQSFTPANCTPVAFVGCCNVSQVNCSFI